MNNIESSLQLPARIDNWWEKTRKESEGSPVLERMQESFDFFKTNGFPHVKLEDWKYTNIRKITDLPYAWPVKEESTLDKATFETFSLAKDIDAYKLVF